MSDPSKPGPDDDESGCCGKLLDVYTRNAVNRPCCCCCSWFSLFGFLAIIGLFAFPVTDPYIMIADGPPRGLCAECPSPDTSRAEMSLMVAQEATVFNPEPFTGQTELQSNSMYSLELIFWSSDEESNLLTETKLGLVRKIESYIEEKPKFGEMCYKVQGEVVCDAESSLTKYLYAAENTACGASAASRRARAAGSGDGEWDTSATHTESTYKPNTNLSATPTFTAETMLYHLGDTSAKMTYCTPDADNNCTASCVKPGPDNTDRFTGKSFNYTSNIRTSWVTKSIFAFGLPLDGYKSANDRKLDQLEKIHDFVVGLRGYLEGADADGVKVGTTTWELFEDYALNDVVPPDVFLIILAILAVWAIAWIKLQSLILATVGVIHVLLSFVVGYFFLTQLFLRVGDKLPFICLLVPFLILGIGADDLFIFIDAWKQSGDVYKRADFPADEDSPETPPRAPWGKGPREGTKLWMVARLKYAYKRSAHAMLITSLTTAVAFLQLFFTSMQLPVRVFGFSAAAAVITNYLYVITYYPALAMGYYLYWYDLCGCCRCACCFKGKSDDDQPETEEPRATESPGGEPIEHEVKGGPVERFFHNIYAPMLHKVKVAVLLLFVFWTCLTIWGASQIKPSADKLKWLPDHDRYQRAADIAEDEFKKNEYGPQITVVHGVDWIDPKGSWPFNPSDIGSVVFDDDFDPSAPGFQATYYSLCQTVAQWDYVTKNADGSGQIECPLYYFKDYVEETLSETFPVPDAEFIPKLRAYVAHYENTTAVAPDLSEEADADGRQDRRWLGQASIFDTIRFDRDTKELKYLAMVANMTGRLWGDPASDIEPRYDYFMEQMDAANDNPANKAVTLGKGFATSYVFVEMFISQDLVRTATVGILVGLIVSFVMIAITTGDIRLALITIICISGVVSSLIASMVWMGWDLGMLEAICAATLVGLAVDYSLHLAVSWREAKDVLERKERSQRALGEIGISVILAAGTTMVSAFFLIICYIVFFQKFGIFLFLTVLYSTLYAFFALMASLQLFGPMSPKNDFVRFYKWITCQKYESPDHTAPAMKNPADKDKSNPPATASGPLDQRGPYAQESHL